MKITAAGNVPRSPKRGALPAAVRLPSPPRGGGNGRIRDAANWETSQTSMIEAAQESSLVRCNTMSRSDVDNCGGGWRRLDDPYGGMPYWHNVRNGATTWEQPFGTFDEEGGRAAVNWKQSIARRFAAEVMTTEEEELPRAVHRADARRRQAQQASPAAECTSLGVSARAGAGAAAATATVTAAVRQRKTEAEAVVVGTAIDYDDVTTKPSRRHTQRDRLDVEVEQKGALGVELISVLLHHRVVVRVERLTTDSILAQRGVLCGDWLDVLHGIHVDLDVQRETLDESELARLLDQIRALRRASSTAVVNLEPLPSAEELFAMYNIEGSKNFDKHEIVPLLNDFILSAVGLMLRTRPLSLVFSRACSSEEARSGTQGDTGSTTAGESAHYDRWHDRPHVDLAAQNSAAVTLQARVRGKLQRCSAEVERQHAAEEAAAVTLQSQLRVQLARQQYALPPADNVGERDSERKKVNASLLPASAPRRGKDDDDDEDSEWLARQQEQAQQLSRQEARRQRVERRLRAAQLTDIDDTEPAQQEPTASAETAVAAAAAKQRARQAARNRRRLERKGGGGGVDDLSWNSESRSLSSVETGTSETSTIVDEDGDDDDEEPY